VRVLSVILCVVTLSVGSSAWVLARGGGASSDTSADLDEYVQVDPLPAEALSSGDALGAELASRLSSWSDGLDVVDLPQADLVAGMDAITQAIASLPETDDDWLTVRQLFDRRLTLCLELPINHPYRGGEYCE
jgi:hypothetical protein